MIVYYSISNFNDLVSVIILCYQFLFNKHERERLVESCLLFFFPGNLRQRNLMICKEAFLCNDPVFIDFHRHRVGV